MRARRRRFQRIRKRARDFYIAAISVLRGNGFSMDAAQRTAEKYAYPLNASDLSRLERWNLVPLNGGVLYKQLPNFIKRPKPKYMFTYDPALAFEVVEYVEQEKAYIFTCTL